MPESATKMEQEKELLSWSAPARPFKKRSKEFYITLIAMAAVVSLILFLVEGWMPVILIISLIFLFYIMNTVEPETIEYKVTNKGIRVAGRTTTWDLMKRFWFSRRFDSDMLIIETVYLPGRMELVLDQSKKDELKKTLSKYLVEEEAPPSFLDRSANWFAKRLPGNG
ncbi:hypothetical protein MUP46_01245 [Patescibacteria group bacterium]|nr:hypothetical protein [Patescibacteria group bacterium]